MISMRELIKDPVYRAYLDKEPFTPAHAGSPHTSGQWVVYVRYRASGPWTRKTFRKYKKALKYFNLALEEGAYDLSFGNRRIYLKPPMRKARIKGKYVIGSDGVKRQATKMVEWLPKLGDSPGVHRWCGFCRRPTVFKVYRKHPAVKLPELTPRPRCCICASSEEIAVKR